EATLVVPPTDRPGGNFTIYTPPADSYRTRSCQVSIRHDESSRALSTREGSKNSATKADSQAPMIVVVSDASRVTDQYAKIEVLHLRRRYGGPLPGRTRN